jgi:Ser/Thr protein kinase RdoA (MazF antagonist)
MPNIDEKRLKEGMICPVVGRDQAEQLARQEFGLNVVGGASRSLGSCQDSNTRITAIAMNRGDDKSKEARFVFKVANIQTPLVSVDLENKAIMHAKQYFEQEQGENKLDIPFPLKCTTWTGDPNDPKQYISQAAVDGCIHHIRVLSFVEGTVLSEFESLGHGELRDVGRVCARFVSAFSSFSHPAQTRQLQWDARLSAQVVQCLSPAIADSVRRDQVLALFERAWNVIEPLEASLRVAIIHGDLAHYNLVATRAADGKAQLSGAIDFGDVGEGWLVSELTIAITVLLARQDLPAIEQASALVQGFHSRCPLNDAEIKAIWPLVVARASVLVASISHQVQIDPTNQYNINENTENAIIFNRVAAVSFEEAEITFRRVIQ